MDDHDLENIVINARVKGSGSKSYDVELVYDEQADDVTESYCDVRPFTAIPTFASIVLRFFLSMKIIRKGSRRFLIIWDPKGRHEKG